MSAQIKSELSREMSLFQVTMMGVGMMIGAGVFIATGIGIGIAGPGGILLAFVLNGLLAFLSVMTYAELGSALPKAGGGYSYVQESSGGLLAFVTGWISWIGHAVAGSLYAITFAKYTLHFLSGFSFFEPFVPYLSILERVVAVAVALLFIYINYRGASETGKAGAAIAIGQTAVLIVIGCGGVIACIVSPERMSNFTPFLKAGWGKVLVVMGFSLIGFEGYEVISHTAEEVIDAKRNVPRGIFYAVIIVITTYLLVACAAIAGAGRIHGSVSEWFLANGATSFAEAIGNLLPLGGVLVVLAVVFASTSALNATIYSSTRVSFALGRDGSLPTIFARVSGKTRIPDVALLFSGVITVAVAALLDVETVMAGASIFFIFLFNLVTFSGLRIRLERGHELNYGYLMPLFPLIPIVSIVGRTVIGIFLLDMGLWAYIIAAAWLAVGFVFYVFRPIKNSAAQAKVADIDELEETEKANGRQLLVAVSHPDTAPALVKYAAVLADAADETLALSTVVRVPYQTPVDVASRFADEAKNNLSTIADTVPAGTPVRKYLRYAHNTAEGIIQSARARNADLLLLGWSGFTHRTHFRMGSTLDPVITRASCDLAVIRPGADEPDREIRKILCPTKGKGPHGRLVWDVAKRLALAYNAEITVMHVTPEGKSGTIPEQLKESVAVEYEGLKYQVRIMQDKDPAARIQAESATYDLVVIGASEQSVFQHILFGSKTRQIAEGCECTVMMIRKNTGIRSWFKRWFL